MANDITVERVKLFAGNGRPIRWVSKVTIPGHHPITFTERLPKGQAIQQARLAVNRVAQQ